VGLRFAIVVTARAQQNNSCHHRANKKLPKTAREPRKPNSNKKPAQARAACREKKNINTTS
jgi:hypothetical protein